MFYHQLCILWFLGLTDENKIAEYLSVGNLLNPFLIKGMKELCERINLAKKLDDRILIFGDYDVDGISATAIMLKTLKRLGINADFYLPNRYEDGYGLSCAVIDKIEKSFVQTLLSQWTVEFLVMKKLNMQRARELR